MISDLVDLTDLPDAFPSFSLIGSSEEREQLTKEIDLAYQESLKADELKTVTSKEEIHNAINFDPDLDVIEKSNINNEEATRIRNARCKRVLPEPSASEEKFMVSVLPHSRYITKIVYTAGYCKCIVWLGWFIKWLSNLFQVSVPINGIKTYKKIGCLSKQTQYWLCQNVSSQYALK